MIWQMKWFRFFGLFLGFFISVLLIVFLWWKDILLTLGTLLIVVICIIIFFLQYYDNEPNENSKEEKRLPGKVFNIILPAPLMLWGIFIFAVTRSPIPRESSNLIGNIFIMIRLLGISIAFQIALSWFVIRIYILQKNLRARSSKEVTDAK